MIYTHTGNNTFGRLAFMKDCHVFFESFLLEGTETDILGLEGIPNIVDAAGLCICLQGEAQVILEAQTYQIRKGDMCVVFPNDILHVREKSDNFMGYTLACTPEFLLSVNIPSSTPLYLYIKEHPCISLTEKEYEELIRMCNFLTEHEAREDHPCREEISRFLVSAIIYEVIAIYKRGEPLEQLPSSRKNRLFYELIQLIARNSYRQRNVEFYAGQLCISSRYLSSVCKEITGMTATECINQHIFGHARLLLASTDMTVLQISEELDFPNPSFFTQFFKKYEGVTPKVYRRKVK